MIFGKYRFSCMLTSDTVLPVFKGSTFRGVFGQSLKNIICALASKDCAACLLKTQCLYVRIFEFDKLNRPETDLSHPKPPAPFVIAPPLSSDTFYPKHSEFSFNLLLFGEINHNLPYFVFAFDRMGRIGIGKKIRGKRGRFYLKTVTANGQTVYDDVTGELNPPDQLEILELQPSENPTAVDRQLKLTLETPLRFKIDNHLSDTLTFPILTKIMIRRVATLMESFGEKPLAFDYPTLAQKAETVNIVANHLEWFDWRRYSNRQKRKMNFGGLTGSIVYSGKIDEFMPFIRFCEKVHLGKQTTFGLGKIKAEII